MNKMKAYLIVLLISLCFFSCDKQFSSEFVFEIGDKHELEDQWTLRLLDIPEDSRCPLLAQCVWPGRIITDFELRHFDLISPFSLSLGAKTEVPTDTVIGDFYFELLSVDPYPDVEIITDKSKYRVSIKVESMSD